MDYSLKLALVGFMYFSVLGRNLVDQNEADQWARQIGDHGENSWEVLQAIARSGEAGGQGAPGGRPLGILGRLAAKIGL